MVFVVVVGTVFRVVRRLWWGGRSGNGVTLLGQSSMVILSFSGATVVKWCRGGGSGVSMMGQKSIVNLSPRPGILRGLCRRDRVTMEVPMSMVRRIVTVRVFAVTVARFCCVVATEGVISVGLLWMIFPWSFWFLAGAVFGGIRPCGTLCNVFGDFCNCTNV